MTPTSRERLAWLTACVMLAVLALQYNGTFGHREDDYNFVRTLLDVHRQVARNYAEPVDEDALRQGAIDGMLAKLDPYTVYVPPAKAEEFNQLMGGQIKGIGVELAVDDDGNIKVVTPIEDSPAARAGILPGDLIVRVNGEEIRGMKIEQVREKILKSPSDVVSIRIRRDGRDIDLPPITRAVVPVPTVRGFRRTATGEWDWYVRKDPKIAYIRVSQFTDNTVPRLQQELTRLLADGMQGLVLDLRWNPGGLLPEATKLVDLFLDSGVIVSTRGRNQPEKIYRAEGPGTLPDFPLTVLVNDDSASASEIVAGALQDNKRAIVVGERTFGKGSVQTVYDLGPRQGELKMTIAYYYLPSGRLVHKKPNATEWGVEPNIKVPTTPDQDRKLAQAQLDGYAGLTRPASRPALPTTLPATLPATPTTLPNAVPTTTPTTSPTTTSPTTRPTGPETLGELDPQLDAAVGAVIGQIHLRNAGGARTP